jgi:hypothetical protein
MHSDNREFNASGDIGTLTHEENNADAFANSHAGRHIILKERLTAAGREPLSAHGTHRSDRAKSCGNAPARGIFGGDSTEPFDDPPEQPLNDPWDHPAMLRS